MWESVSVCVFSCAPGCGFCNGGYLHALYLIVCHCCFGWGNDEKGINWEIVETAGCPLSLHPGGTH